MRIEIDYFFAPQSPWSFLGFERFAALVDKSHAEVRVLPCDIGRVFASSGGLPLAERPKQRQAYRLIELKRFSEYLNIPIHVKPRHFPVAGSDAARLIIAASEASGMRAALTLSGAIGRALWCEERDIADHGTLSEVAAACGLDASSLLAASSKAEVAATYEANTQAAIERSVFGAPTYILDGEPFWGQDRLDFLERAVLRRMT